MLIEKDGIRLRPWRQEDAERLASIADNKKIFDNLRDAFPHPYTLENAKSFIASVQPKDKPPTIMAIEVGGLLAGSIGIYSKEDVSRKTAEIGYFLGEEYWGRGIAAVAIRLMTEYVFATFDIVRIFAEPFAYNHASRRVLEKAGFRLEAIQKNSIYKNSAIGNSCIYYILREGNPSPEEKPMRRMDKNINDRSLIEKILTEAPVIRLAMCEGAVPYIVAMNFAYADGCIYMHSAKEGRKIRILETNNLVAFQTETEASVLLAEDVCTCTTRYTSVAGSGKAFLLDDPAEKVKALDAIMKKYSGKSGFSYPDKMLEKTFAIKIEIDSLTGKKSGY